jgi:hypothetical protein
LPCNQNEDFKVNDTAFVLNEEIARRVLSTVDAGLCAGVGEPQPGKMCVMAAINYALGREHGDNPETCVGFAVRAFDIKLNDADWSSNAARAKGMRAEAIAKLGSNNLNQQEFAKRLAIKTVNVLLPVTLRALIALIPSHADVLEISARTCETATDTRAAESAASAAESAARSAEGAASAAESAARSAAWSAARSAAESVESAAESAARSAEGAASAAESAARSAAWSAVSAASAAESAARSAASAAESAARSAASVARDNTLTLAANMAKDVLVEMGSEGSKYLYLIEE